MQNDKVSFQGPVFITSKKMWRCVIKRNHEILLVVTDEKKDICEQKAVYLSKQIKTWEDESNNDGI